MHVHGRSQTSSPVRIRHIHLVRCGLDSTVRRGERMGWADFSRLGSHVDGRLPRVIVVHVRPSSCAPLPVTRLVSLVTTRFAIPWQYRRNRSLFVKCCKHNDVIRASLHVHPIACTSKTHPLRWHGANRQGPNPLKRSSRSEDGSMM